MSGADLLTFGIIADRFVGKTSPAKANVLSSSAYSVYVIVILKNGYRTSKCDTPFLIYTSIFFDSVSLQKSCAVYQYDKCADIVKEGSRKGAYYTEC